MAVKVSFQTKKREKDSKVELEEKNLKQEKAGVDEEHHGQQAWPQFVATVAMNSIVVFSSNRRAVHHNRQQGSGQKTSGLLIDHTHTHTWVIGWCTLQMQNSKHRNQGMVVDRKARQETDARISCFLFLQTVGKCRRKWIPDGNRRKKVAEETDKHTGKNGPFGWAKR